MGDGTASTPATLDRERCRAWLLGPQVVDGDGRVWSWHADAHPGYPYPEAGGLWLGWAAHALPVDHPRTLAVARWLSHEIAADRIGRDGLAYTFDLGVVLRGLLAWWQVGGRPPRDVLAGGATRLCTAIRCRRAIWGGEARADRWSTRFGTHQRKLLFALAAIERAELCVVGRARDVLLEDIEARCAQPYLHAHAYALEGLALAAGTGLVGAQAAAALDHQLDLLAAAQRSDGGIPACRPLDAGEQPPARSDVTAQAVRLWAIRDRRRWRTSIASGLGFLARMARGDGVRYDDRCDDRNVWCTLFALQAAELAVGDGDVTQLL